MVVCDGIKPDELRSPWEQGRARKERQARKRKACSTLTLLQIPLLDHGHQ